MVHDRNCKVRMVGRFLLRNILAVGDILWAYCFGGGQFSTTGDQGLNPLATALLCQLQVLTHGSESNTSILESLGSFWIPKKPSELPYLPVFWVPGGHLTHCRPGRRLSLWVRFSAARS